MFGSKRLRGQALVVAADELPDHRADGGDTWAVEDFASAMWGRSSHHLVLDVHLPGHGPYRVQGEWKVPNRLGSLRKTILRGRHLRPGMWVPVLVDPNEFGEVEIDWKGFVQSGQLEQHDEPGVIATISGGIKEMVADMRASGPADATPPSAPRPTDTTHPPIAGVGFEQWISANARAVVEKVRRKHSEAHYLACGFPQGSVDQINTGWYERAKTDPAVSAWYVYEMQKARG